MIKTGGKAKKNAIDEFKKYINMTQAVFLGTVDLDIIEGERYGVFVRDTGDNREYIDCFSSAGSFNVGRRNAGIVAELDAALDRLDSGDAAFVSREKSALADKLCGITPAGLDRVIFAAGGGEANDIAIKLARGATGRPGVIATVKAYHGHTGFSLSGIGKPVYREPFEPLMPGFEFVPINDVAALDKAAGPDTAAIIFEPVQGEGGIHIATQEFMEAARRICDERGIMLILDEIQTGFGRTGKMFCCEHYGVTPDIMTLAKSLGGSVYPISAVVYNERVSRFVEENPEAIESTTGGTDLACVVGQAVIDCIVRNDIPAHVARVGDYMGRGLDRLASKYGKLVHEVRRKGLMIGLEYTHDMMGPLMSFFLGMNGVLAVFSGNNPKVMRIMPPIVLNESEADRLLDALDKAMDLSQRSAKLVMAASKIPLVDKAINVQELQVGIIFMARTLLKVFPFLRNAKFAK